MTPADPLAPMYAAAAALQGLLTMSGLIVAIGAQNALVLRQGLARAHVWQVVVLCTVSDWLLTGLGVFGLGSAISRSPVWLDLCRYAGAAFLLVYGLRSAWRAWKGPAEALVAAGSVQRLGPTLAATLAMTYLNPHVYLDTVVLMGTLGAQHAGEARVAFVGGAGLASALWFSALGFGAAAASRWLRQPGVWRAIDAAIAAVMLWMAMQLLLQPLKA